MSEFIEILKTGDEKALREVRVPFPESLSQVNEAIEALKNRKHDYGTCVYAMSISAVIVFNYLSNILGTTGFQVSCADMDILARTRNFKWGRILNYENLLYPQYCDDEHFPSWRVLLEENKDELAKRAKAKLNENDVAHEDVLAHWRKLAKAGINS